ncbi:hypothetical protein [Sedimentibacter sp. MB31-C6]|uniref:hypothetical protein n=1 Tax=Sedimentibacter sp. MB31-C6 TaxID=3109366 RepID=UPI002DDCE814|nr:hypothetical protein [Sedimentibacter sp. MB36-C1]WSI04778.1 hypothetical protein U8307_03050 [Sedimentibacter sp. MB36-C1]
MNSAKRRQPKFQREECVVLVYKYFMTKNNGSNQNQVCEDLSKFYRIRAKKLGYKIDDTFRNTPGIEMQFGTLKNLDKDYKGIGFTNSSKLCRELVEEYYEKPDVIIKEAEEIINKYEEE